MEPEIDKKSAERINVRNDDKYGFKRADIFWKLN